MLFFASQVYAHTEAPNTGGGSNFTLFAAAGPHNLKNKVKMGRKLSRYVKNCQDKIVMISLMILYNIFLYGREILP